MSGSVTRRGVTSRRGFLRLAGGAAGAAVLAACGAPGGGERSEGTPEAETRLIGAPPIDEREVVAVLERPPRPEPAWARGDRRQLERLALPGTDWETPIYINRSGEPGPSVMVLGGVHGNEPGGWAAAETIADWMPDRGLTVVIPRANIVATEAFERTLPELGDLNRFYPGEPAESVNAFPMQWMAYSIIELAREFEVSLLLDLHESWGFFNERTQNGTAFLGQTVTNGASTEETGRIEAIALEVNEQITEREQLVIRDRFRNRFQRTTPNTNFDPSWPRGGTSSLGIGQFVPGLVPVLIEMGQQDQPEARRSELHQLIVRTSLRHEGMLTA
jgi:predicted deacylase